MFKRFRHLQLSLAAKCQLLFGTAVALIIAAALFVPWQRMEQLTVQLNERTAEALASNALAAHVADPRHAGSIAATRVSRAAAGPPQAVTRPATAATAHAFPVGDAFQPPRLIGAKLARDPAHAATALTALERRAFARFANDSDLEYWPRAYETRDGEPRYFYAAALYATGECLRCHAADGASLAAGRSKAPAVLNGTAAVAAAAAAAASAPPASRPAPRANRAGGPAAGAASAVTQPATQPAGLLGIISIDIPSQIDANQLLLNRIFILTAGLIAGTLAIIVFYLITTRLILQPVRVLQETAEKVSEGNLDIRSDINTGDEFQQLSETFNTMLINLKAGEDQLRAINNSLDLKIGQLAESNVTLYESNRLKSEFLANVSHELRTPLNSILGFAELLKDAMANHPDAKVVRYAQNILSSGKNLLDLINDLLDLAKIEAGRMEIRSEPLSLGDLFEGLSSILKPLCEQKTLTVAASVAGDVPIIHTDPAKLQQVLYNFLSNAIKFSPVGAQIELAAQRHGEENIRISVSDRGPGIEPAKQEIIFEKFRQIDGSVTRQHGGSGLGLAISKELVLLLGGSIGVRSTPGEGATFWIVLPLKIQPRTQELRGKLMLA